MKRTIPIAAFALATCWITTPSFAADDHKLITPYDVKWSPAPPVLPKGVEASVLHGDPTKEGLLLWSRQAGLPRFRRLSRDVAPD